MVNTINSITADEIHTVEMKPTTQEELNQIAADYKVCLRKGGVRPRMECRDYRGLDFFGMDFSFASMDYSDFRGAKLEGVNFKNAHLMHCDLRGVDFKGASTKHVAFDYSITK